MGLHNPLDDRETKAGAAGGTIRLPEAVEDRRQGGGGNSAARVPNHDLNVGGALPRLYTHTSTGRRELDRVRHEIGDRLAETLLVAADCAQISGDLRLKVHVACARGRLASFEDFGD